VIHYGTAFYLSFEKRQGIRVNNSFYEVSQPRGAGKILFDIIKFVGFIVLASLPIIVLTTLMGYQDDLPNSMNYLLGIAYLVFVLALMWFLWNRYHTYAKDNIKSIKGRDVGFVLLFYFIGRIVAIGGTALIQAIYGEEATANDQIINAMTDKSTFPLYLIGFVLSMGILIPIIEELTYRGIAVNLLFKKGRFWAPLIVTSLIFGSLHASTDIISFFIYVLMGAVFFLAYHRRRNIVDSILVHVLNNIFGAISILILYLT